MYGHSVTVYHCYIPYFTDIYEFDQWLFAFHIYLENRGGSAATNGPDIQARLDELQAEVEYLENLEKKVDEHRGKVLQSLKNVQEDLDNLQYAYVTHQDLINIFQDRTMLIIRAPPGTKLEAPVPENPMEQQPVQTIFSLKRSYKVSLCTFQFHCWRYFKIISF